MPINKRLYEEMQAKRDVEHREAERVRRRALFLAAAFCIMWSVLGLVCFAFAFHTTDAGWAAIYQDAAYVVTYGGITFTLARAYGQGEERGDW